MWTTGPHVLKKTILHRIVQIFLELKLSYHTMQINHDMVYSIPCVSNATPHNLVQNTFYKPHLK